MRMPRGFVWWLSLPVLLAGCVGAPAPRVYVLGDAPNPPPGVASLAGRPVLQLLPVAVPDYLDTRDILLRSGANEVKPSPTGRWADRLSVGLTRALAVALAVRLPGTTVVTDPPVAPPARQAVVTVDSFEIRPDGQCLLAAHWTVTGGDGRSVLRSERGTFAEQAGDAGDAAVAAAMTRAVDRLAERLAAGG